MNNCMIGFPNRADVCTLTGGAWTMGLPRANLQNRILGKVARTIDDAVASTKFDINLGAPKHTRLLALANHNISLDGRYRVRGSSDPTFATSDVDTGWNDVWPAVYPDGTLEWEDENWWDRRYSLEEIQGYKPLLTVILPVPYALQYWRVEIDDVTNPDGYLQFGRLFIGPAWQPAYNHSYGLTNAWETTTTVQTAVGGAEYFNEGPTFRVVRFSLDWLSQDEALAKAFEMDRRAGIHKEVLWIQNPSDTVHALRLRFLGRLRELTPIEHPYTNTNKKPYQIKELL